MIDSETQTDDILINGISFIEIIKNNKLYNISLHSNRDTHEEDNIEDENSGEEDNTEEDNTEEDSGEENSILSEKDIQDLYDCIFYSIDENVRNNPLSFSDPLFHSKLENSIYEIIETCFSDSSSCDIFNFSEEMERQVEEIVDICLEHYFDTVIPPRSYPNTFILTPPNIEETRKKIEYLKSIPQDEQRTPAWYIFRNNLITASSAWKVFKTESCMNQLIYEKCKSNINIVSANNAEINEFDKESEILVEKERTFVNTNSPLHWGQKYERLSVIIYESRNNTKVGEFGCIKHPKYHFLGASPDGINVDPNSPLYGRMLEIKNIFNREINGIPFEEYWIQTQLQMQVCNCDECDFLETSFKEYDDEEAFLNDSFSENNTEFHLTSAKTLKGVIAYFMKDGKPFYEYAPLYLTRSEYDKWCEEIIDKNSGITWLKNIYWYLNHYSCVLIRKNDIWFEEAIKKIENVWNIIVREREIGYEHRAPKKRNPRKKNNIVEDENTVESGSGLGSGSGCLIVISDLELNL
jgi:YqaJ-like viral recombinase domain